MFAGRLSRASGGPDGLGSEGPAGYFVRKLLVADDRLPTWSRLSTWKKYWVLRARPVIVTEWLLTRVRSTGVELP